MHSAIGSALRVYFSETFFLCCYEVLIPGLRTSVYVQLSSSGCAGGLDFNSPVILSWMLTYDISNVVLEQENVLGESRMMIPDCRKRLESAFDTLKETVVCLLNHQRSCFHPGYCVKLTRQSFQDCRGAYARISVRVKGLQLRSDLLRWCRFYLD